MKFIFDSGSINENKNILESFEDIYITGFPDSDEREKFSDILDRISGLKNDADPNSIIILCITDGEKPEVTGGLIADWYAKSQAIHLTYLIVNEKFRQQKIATKLILQGIPDIINWIKINKGVDIKNTFFESNNPVKTTIDNFDGTTRLKIFSRLGAKAINIPYIQPALSKDKNDVDNLLLLSFTQFNESGNKIPECEIESFLEEFFAGLGKDNQYPALLAMYKHLKNLQDDDGYIELDDIVEYHSYKFKKASVTYHYVENLPKKTDCSEDNTEDCNAFRSYETDLFNYKNQQNRPFKTIFKEYFQDIELLFYPAYSYTSEGLIHTRASDRKGVNINLSISYSIVPKSGCKIIHVSFAPACESYFSEIELIKFSSFFGSKQENRTTKNELKVSINGREITINELLSEQFSKKATYQNLSTGIVQIDLSDNSVTDSNYSDEFFKVFMSDKKCHLDEEITGFSKALCGIILGIFDFNRMSEEEIYDTIIPIISYDQSFAVTCRGNLLKISKDDGFIGDIISGKIIVSPYMLITNMLLAYNEHILNNAVSMLEKPYIDLDVYSLEKLHLDIKDILNIQYLQDVFQYPSEREVVEYGNIQRGINSTYNLILKKIDMLSETIDNKRVNRTNRSDAILNALLGFIAALQVKNLVFDFDGFSLKEVIPYIICLSIAVAIYYLVRAKRSYK